MNYQTLTHHSQSIYIFIIDARRDHFGTLFIVLDDAERGGEIEVVAVERNRVDGERRRQIRITYIRQIHYLAVVVEQIYISRLIGNQQIMSVEIIEYIDYITIAQLITTVIGIVFIGFLII